MVDDKYEWHGVKIKIKIQLLPYLGTLDVLPIYLLLF